MKSRTDTKYGVARGEKVIGDILHDTYAEAEGRLLDMEGAMRYADLEPDLRLVEIEVKTTYSRPHAAKAPEPGEITVPKDASTGQGEALPESGVWGGPNVALPTIPNPLGEPLGGDDGAPTADQFVSNTPGEPVILVPGDTAADTSEPNPEA